MKPVVSHELIVGYIYRDTVDPHKMTKFRYLGRESERDIFRPVTECTNPNYKFNKNGTGRFFITETYDDPWFYFEEDNFKLGK